MHISIHTRVAVIKLYYYYIIGIALFETARSIFISNYND